MTWNSPFDETHWRRNSYLFLLSQFITGITSMVVQYAIIWYLAKESNSATLLSLATLLGMLPMVLVSPFLGTFIDRWNKKLLLITPDVVAAMAAVVLSIVGTVNSTFPVWLIFVSLLVRSVAQAFQMPTIQSILPTIVPVDEITKTNGQLGMVQSATMVVAPALGAAMYAIIPINYLILIDVLGAIFGIAMLSLIHIPSNVGKAGEHPHMLADAVFGFKRIGTVQGLWPMLLISSLFTFMFMPAASMYPLMTFRYFHGSVQQAGIVEVIWSVGSLLGGGGHRHVRHVEGPCSPFGDRHRGARLRIYRRRAVACNHGRFRVVRGAQRDCGLGHGVPQHFAHGDDSAVVPRRGARPCVRRVHGVLGSGGAARPLNRRACSGCCRRRMDIRMFRLGFAPVRAVVLHGALHAPLRPPAAGQNPGSERSLK